MKKIVMTLSLLAALALALTTCKDDEQLEEEDEDSGLEDLEDASDDAGLDEKDAGDDEETQVEAPGDEGGENLDKLADALQAKKLELDLREREVIQREQLIESLELAAVQKSEELNKIKREAAQLLERLAKQYEKERKLYEEERKQREKDLKEAVDEMSSEREDRIDHLVKSVKSMRPAAGANLLASMEERDAIMVLRQLSSRKAASLLGEMPPRKAAQLAQGMLGPRLPTPEVLAGEPPKEPGEEQE